MAIRFYISLVEGFTLVQNPDFQAWFSGSKVVDAQGNPLPCYHGTSGNHRFYGPLTHFGTLAAAQDRMATKWDKELVSPAVKSDWTGKVVTRAKYRLTPTAFSSGTNIRPVFLRITKPFKYRDNGDEDAMFPIATTMRDKGLLTPVSMQRSMLVKIVTSSSWLVCRSEDTTGYATSIGARTPARCRG